MAQTARNPAGFVLALQRATGWNLLEGVLDPAATDNLRRMGLLRFSPALRSERCVSGLVSRMRPMPTNCRFARPLFLSVRLVRRAGASADWQGVADNETIKGIDP